MRIAYRYQRDGATCGVVFAYRVGPRGGIKEYLDGFNDLNELRKYAADDDIIYKL